MAYAETTSVPFEKSISEIVGLVRKHGAEQIGQMEDPGYFALQFKISERVVMHKGRLAPEGSTATAYAWLIWLPCIEDTRLRWIAPCRKRLERDGDYEQ